MSLYFVIQSGPLQGESYEISPNMTVGRGDKADISIADPNISFLHAQIQKKDNQFYLIDKGSKNKIKVDKTKQDSVALQHLLMFQLGNTKIQINDSDYKEPQLQKKNWKQKLYTDLEQEVFVNDNVSENIKALNPSISLSFISGIQTKTKYILGYGPRNIGSSSMDLPIIGENIPENCFSIFLEDQKTVFKTNHTKRVLLNQKPINKSIVKDKDIIYIDNIKIKINLL